MSDDIFYHRKKDLPSKESKPYPDTPKQSLRQNLARPRAGQDSFCGRYPSTPHPAGFLARASPPAAPSRFRNGICGGLFAYSDRIAQVSHLIPYYLPPPTAREHWMWVFTSAVLYTVRYSLSSIILLQHLSASFPQRLFPLLIQQLLTIFQVWLTAVQADEIHSPIHPCEGGDKQDHLLPVAKAVHKKGKRTVQAVFHLSTPI